MDWIVLWLIVPLFLWLGLPLLAATMIERYREQRLALRYSNCCFRCRYDLRGLPDSSRCPECGKVVADRIPAEHR